MSVSLTHSLLFPPSLHYHLLSTPKSRTPHEAASRAHDAQLSGQLRFVSHHGGLPTPTLHSRRHDPIPLGRLHFLFAGDFSR